MKRNRKPKPQDPKTIGIIKAWLKKDGNSKVKLATLLGYETSSVVDQWIHRKRVPDHQKPRVLAIVQEE